MDRHHGLESPFVCDDFGYSLPSRGCLVGITLWGWRQFRNPPPSPAVPAVRSLAVLPLENLSEDPSQQYLADGMIRAIGGTCAGSEI